MVQNETLPSRSLDDNMAPDRTPWFSEQNPKGLRRQF